MFLETITFVGNDALVPVDKIKHINRGYYENGYQIKIKSIYEDAEWVECFGEDEKKCDERYRQIKKILEVR